MKNAITMVFVLALFTLLMLASGCSQPEAPAHISIDSEFNEAERETIRATVDAWCDAVGWCPEEGIWTDRGRFALVDDLPEDDNTGRVCPKGHTCSTNGKNDGDNIAVARNRRAPEDMEVLWRIVAHEIGHFRTEHTKTGLMAAYQPPTAPCEVDDVAIHAWNEEHGR